MYALKRTGHGQTLCAGCLAKGKQALNWDSWLYEVKYEGGTTIGNYCGECLAEIRKHNKVEVKNGTKRISD